MRPEVLYLSVILAAAVGTACGTGNKYAATTSDSLVAEAPDETADEAITDDSTDGFATYLIADRSAGPFKLGDIIPEDPDGFSMSVSEEVRADSEGKAVRIPAYTYEIGNEGWVKITPLPDPSPEHERGRIGWIYVYSDLFLTEKGIGAMSSVRDFAAAYPDLDISYDAGNEVFIIETPQLPDVRFLLDREHYAGDLTGSDSGINAGLKVSDFRENACFTAIRIGQ